MNENILTAETADSRPRGIDLHTHSTASDGSFAPGMIPQLAWESNLSAVALTDHDTVDGIAEFMAAGAAYPELEAIPGVELSTLYCSREMHFVGLYIDCGSEKLHEFLEMQRAERVERAARINSKLVSLGYPLSETDLTAAGATGTIGRPHFAKALMEKYGFASMAVVFDKLLKHNAPAYVPRKLPPPHAAIEAIHSAGGVAVWAHPVYRQRNERAWAKRIMRKLKPVGLDAVEGYYSMFGPGETALVSELAAMNGLALSGGSDFHGENTPNIRIGCGAGKLYVPPELLKELRHVHSTSERQ